MVRSGLGVKPLLFGASQSVRARLLELKREQATNRCSLPIGVSDFRELVTKKTVDGTPYLFVDKTLFIKDLLDDGSKVQLVTRPRRFGKTLNLSMLHHFLAKTIDGQPTAELFHDLKIAKHPAHLDKYQGKHPVVFFTFKDINSQTFEGSYEGIKKLLSAVYEEHERVLLGSSLTDRQKDRYKKILEETATESEMKDALRDLCFYLYRGYGSKPFVLIDEYDSPIQSAYVNGCYPEMVDFMRGFLGAGLKDNPYLEKAVLTGILRVSKESVFSGLNNTQAYSMLSSNYGEHFGFTEEEVRVLLEQARLSKNIGSVRNWYNGYQCGKHVIYNPWSIVRYLKEEKFISYWVNTSDNELIKNLLLKSGTEFKSQFEPLLQDKPVDMLINEHVGFVSLETNESAVWTLLLMSGYLKASVLKEEGANVLCRLEIPNKEVKDLYQIFIAEWLSGVNNATRFNEFIGDLLDGNVGRFEEKLKQIMLQTFSVHDIQGKQPEKFFHGFLLGLAAGIDPKQYTIDSNKESGLGRYDIVIVPKDPKRLGILIELKSVKEGSDLAKAAQEALGQIEAKKYSHSVLLESTDQLLKIGVAFSGKTLAIEHQQMSKEQFFSSPIPKT